MSEQLTIHISYLEIPPDTLNIVHIKDLVLNGGKKDSTKWEDDSAHFFLIQPHINCESNFLKLCL